ncbi:MAG: hypothetical protein RL131_914 [Bacteroidota bacterium]
MEMGLNNRFQAGTKLGESFYPFRVKIFKFVRMTQLLLRPTLQLSYSNGRTSENSSQKLFLELGENHFSYLITDHSIQNVHSFQFFTGDGKMRVEDVESILQNDDLSSRSFLDVLLVNNTKDFALVPSAFHKEHVNEAIINTIHGDLGETKLHEDDVHQWELINVHRIPNEIMAVIHSQFSDCKYVHVFSPLLKNLFRSLTEDTKELVKLYFYPSNLNVIAVKEDQLLIAQQFYYETSEDVIYHLLNIADKFRLDVTELVMQVSGSIDEQSSMWKELLKYFLNVELDQSFALGLSMVDASEMPTHYFTPSLLIPSCV